MRIRTTDHPEHHCGIFGISGSQTAARHVYQGLYALQHRGEESSGIVSSNGQKLFAHKDMGLVLHVFNDGILEALSGNMAIGHNRYSTTGSSELSNAQPIVIDCKLGQIALAHNGNLTNTDSLRHRLAEAGAIFQTSTDSEVMLHLIARSDKSLEQAVLDMMDQVEGAYSLVIMTTNKLIAVRDPHGFRPLALGRLGKAWVFSSETCAFDATEASFVRELEPGEIAVISNGALQSLHSPRKVQSHAFCAFEAVYFARPDSLVYGRKTAIIRMDMGRALAMEYPLTADIVIPIPDSGNYAALGFASARGIPYVMAFVRNHYTGRSFIAPTENRRQATVNMKLNLIGELVDGKRVVVVDDSIVRGRTGKSRCIKLRQAGAKEVHMLVSCPAHIYSCLYGIDFPDRQKLIAVTHSHDKIVKELGLDSLGYLSEAGMAKAIGGTGLCLACFNGKYPQYCSS